MVTRLIALPIRVKLIYFIKQIAKRTRRSKNEQAGRNHRCLTCGKSYLSQPALTNHNKTKHFQNDPTFKRGRGRPRKNVIQYYLVKNYKNFFLFYAQILFSYFFI